MLILYSISNVTNDEVSLITTLAAKTAPWSEIAGTFDMNFGSTVVAPGATRRLLVRGFFDDLKNAAGDVVDQVGDVANDVVDGAKDVAGDIVDGAGQAVDTVTDGVKDAADAVGDTVGDVVADVGSGQINKEVTFDVTIGQQGQRFNVLTDPIRYEYSCMLVNPTTLKYLLTLAKHRTCHRRRLHRLLHYRQVQSRRKSLGHQLPSPRTHPKRLTPRLPKQIRTRSHDFSISSCRPSKLEPHQGDCKFPHPRRWYRCAWYL